MDGTGERERFAAELRARGEDEATVDAFVRIAERVTAVAGGWDVRPKHVDEALRRAEADGAQPHQLANLKRVGDDLVRFSRKASVPPPAAAPVAPGSCAGCGGGLQCVTPDDEMIVRIGGPLTMFGSIIGVRLFGCFGLLTAILALCAVGALARAVRMRVVCISCGRVAARGELDDARARELFVGRRNLGLGALGLGLGALAAFALWIGIAVWANAP